MRASRCRSVPSMGCPPGRTGERRDHTAALRPTRKPLSTVTQKCRTLSFPLLENDSATPQGKSPAYVERRLVWSSAARCLLTPSLGPIFFGAISWGTFNSRSSHSGDSG